MAKYRNNGPTLVTINYNEKVGEGDNQRTVSRSLSFPPGAVVDIPDGHEDMIRGEHSSPVASKLLDQLSPEPEDDQSGKPKIELLHQGMHPNAVAARAPTPGQGQPTNWPKGQALPGQTQDLQDAMKSAGQSQLQDAQAGESAGAPQGQTSQASQAGGAKTQAQAPAGQSKKSAAPTGESTPSHPPPPPSEEDSTSGDEKKGFFGRSKK